jgi:GPH family glycoside/pentoside/hexuronide:cation symporter
VFAWIFGLVNALVAYTVFLKSTPEQPMGLLNAKGYAPYAMFGAVVMFLAMAVSAFGTQRAARERTSLGGEVHMSLRDVPRAMRKALETKSYRAVVAAGLFLFVGFGIAENLNNYMNTFFWGFSSEQIGKFIVVIFFASLTVLSLARYLLTRFGSRKVGMGCAVIMGTVGPSAIGLRLGGMMPEMGDPKLFSALCVVAFIQYAGVILSMTVIGKMIADVTDEHELLTGARQEGLLFSANMFLTKAASGLGTLGSGVLIKLAHFPKNASPSDVDPSIVTNLGVGAALASVAFGCVTYFFYSRFQLSQERHDEIVRELGRRRGAALPVGETAAGEKQVAAYAQG